jgi:hypothetical protein
MALYNMRGKVVQSVRVDETYYDFTDVYVEIPGASQLLTFDVLDWLILDSYGDDSYPAPIRKKLFGDEETIAVHKKTGQIAFVSSFEGDGEDPPIIGLDTVVDFLPLSYLSKLDELRTQKRPFRTVPDPFILMNVMEHDATWKDVKDNLTFHFEFRKGYILEVVGMSYREIGLWTHE